MMRNKIVESAYIHEFEKQMDDFLADKDSYSIQYKPCHIGGSNVLYNALITYMDYVVPYLDQEADDDE